MIAGVLPPHGQNAHSGRRSALPQRLLLVLSLLLAALSLASATSRVRGGGSASTALAQRRSAAEGPQEPMHARGRRRMQTGGYWVRNGACLSSSSCSSNGWCESASTWTSTGGCGSSKTVSTWVRAVANWR
eukprot:XP_001699054.1 predicted protein [Chlamydomonas reinhardtii]